MAWPDSIASAEEVDIETTRGEDAPIHRTTIWAVVDGGDVLIRSLRGTAGRWFRELMANPDAVLYVNGDSYPVRAVLAADDDSIERTSEGFRRKYAGSPYVDSMLVDDILETTVRLDPR
jgi:hypothetical protein